MRESKKAASFSLGEGHPRGRIGKSLERFLVCSELHTKIGKREETVCIVETLLVFTVAALHFCRCDVACMGRSVLCRNPKARSGQFNDVVSRSFLLSREIGW